MRLPEDGPRHGLKNIFDGCICNICYVDGQITNYHITQQDANDKDYDFAYSFV
jgi:hypothetical protein